MRLGGSRCVGAALAGLGLVVAVGLLDPSVAAAQSYDRLRCESRDGREEWCRAEISGDVRVYRQLSDTACREGRNWRWTRDGIAVRDGCRAEFEYRRSDRGGGWGGSGGGGWGGGGGNWNDSRYDRVTCQSVKDRDQFCPAPIGGEVRIVRQMSDTDCRQGRNWWWNQEGVRVSDGCRAEFSYRRRGSGGSGGSGWGGSGGSGGGGWGGSGSNRGSVTCQSEKDRERFCPAPIDGDVRLKRQISDTPCRQGRNWSWSRDGVRVWGGCRGDFDYRKR